MILIDDQIISPILVKSLQELNVPVFKQGNRSEMSKSLQLMDANDFFSIIDEHQKLLTNSESCLALLESHAPDSVQNRWAKQLKDKGIFRQILSKMYPDYFYKVVNLDELYKIPVEDIPFPVVIKPSKGYSSVGVYKVKNAEEWRAALEKLSVDMLLIKNIYDKEVINGESVLIEKWVFGEEYAVDGYYDHDGNPVILNIFKHLFKDEYDTSDRIYYTSREVIQEIYDDILTFMYKFKEIVPLKNFPLHFEVRKNDHAIIPIEMNPLRFAGAGTTDLGFHAYGCNVYKHYFQGTRPDWEAVLRKMDQSIYSFFCAEIPMDISRTLIKSIDHQSFKKQFQQILEYREIQALNDRVFAIVFSKNGSMEELYQLLEMDLRPFIALKEMEHSRER
ncbi:ATP-grasp domain-containing protein [Ureibacillus terrenus]|uniref:ATP-grasp domain-containing protein n=1 Tax=Ureibacillus terrenus TaxID=118246 RepID=A0A540V1S6_9BACL|nr:ATP-grasp domain-containing protein [Ureibacillus terrenus]MED3661011.1 ATP-grasp domain-containing protein [Ureibacillus terrenus]TQE90714.1 ATP-grasp domain-containing protein [Ureibacillus terrenus]